MGNVCVGQDGRAVSAVFVMMSVKCQTAMATGTVLMAAVSVPRATRVNSVKKV